MTVDHAGLQSTVADLSGWRCGACGEALFDADGAARYAAAGDALVLQERERQRQEIRRIRRKLGLSQAQASALTGGGPNAFSRYELGKAKPMPAVTNLLLLLDRHPDLLHELPA
jgi:HTH-type transcriptional regulator/antitoxin MqsA